MKLIVFERINLLSILPVQGDFTSLKIIRKLREDLSCDEQENKVLQFKDVWVCPECSRIVEVKVEDDPPDCPKCIEVCPKCKTHLGKKAMRKTGQVTWNRKAAKEKDIEMGNKAHSIIRDTLKELNENAKNKEKELPCLRDEHFTLYQKFCEDEE